MAQTTPKALLAAEIKAQIAAAVSGLEYCDVETYQERQRWQRDFVVILPQNEEPEQADNESVFNSYSFTILVGTLGENRQSAADRLDASLRTIRLTLADRASDRSPLLTNPLPLTTPATLSTYGSAALEVFVEATIIGSEPQDKMFRHAGMVTVRVVCYETETG